MAKSTRQRAHPQGTNARNRLVHRPRGSPARAPDLSRRARCPARDARLARSATAATSAGPPATSGTAVPPCTAGSAATTGTASRASRTARSRPVRRRRPTWTLAQLTAVRRLRERYPRWGKDKLAVLLRREGLVLSVSMVGRILERLRRTGELREPARRRISARKRAWRRPHAVRKPRDFIAARPGDLVQVDTLDVRPLPGLVLKQFTARDVVSRWDVLELRTTASARSRSRSSTPWRPGCRSGSGPSASTTARSSWPSSSRPARTAGSPCSPCHPGAPSSTARVERANRTHTEEFYEVTDAEATLADLRPALLAWETTYNTVRPHQALGYLTPAEYLASLGIDV